MDRQIVLGEFKYRPYEETSTLPVNLKKGDQTRITFWWVNGVEKKLWVSPNELLLNVLRERLELTGAKYGCGLGECSACTVEIDGQPMLSCLTLAVAVDGKKVVTVGRNAKIEWRSCTLYTTVFYRLFGLSMRILHARLFGDVKMPFRRIAQTNGK